MIAVAHYATDSAHGVGGVTVDDLLSVMRGAVDERTRPSRGEVRWEIDQICVGAVCAAVHQVCVGKDGKRRSNGRALDQRIQSGAFAAELQQVWDETTSAGSAEALGSSGAFPTVDVEALVWIAAAFEAQRHIKLIWAEANKLVGRLPDTTADDLFGWGWIGLLAALRKYDPDRGLAFSTFACKKISFAMRDGARSDSPMQKRALTFVRKATHSEEVLANELGRPPTREELAERIGRSVSDIELLPRLAQAASLDELSAGVDGESRELIVDLTDPADVAAGVELKERIEAALASLDPQDAEAVRLLDYEPVDPVVARQLTGCTQRQLRQRANRGKTLLAALLADYADV
jgi:RNA polymerase sigma factor for flagellar operon FliA